MLMDVALCFPSVRPGRGGCETYITDLARRLARDGHGVHVLASDWDAAALPAATHFHRVEAPRGPRWLRPWLFGGRCLQVLESMPGVVSIGFDKTWGQDVLYPQGGLHAAAAEHNLLKFRAPLQRMLAAGCKRLDPANRSFRMLERRQYLGHPRPLIVVNSRMVQRHFEDHYGIPPETITVLHSAIDPQRFAAEDRPRRRALERARWGCPPDEAVGLFAAMNYRLKGLEPLLRAMPADARLAVIGHPRDGKYRRFAESLGINDRVMFLGHRPDPRDAYFAADYLVHPTFYDPCSLVVLEALACGLPVITTRFNGASELLGDAGMVVNDPHDAAELGAAIGRMSGAAFRQRASAAARCIASRWTFEEHYRGLMGILGQRAHIRRAA